MKTPFRVTPATLDVLGVLLTADGPVHGYLAAQQAGRPRGTVQPILNRMERFGWVTSAREIHNPITGRPPRRLYEVTEEGRELGCEVLAERRPKNV